MPRFKYDLLCKDIADEEFHHVLTRDFNPILVEIAWKTGAMMSRIPSRILREWINEYDGARVELIWTYDQKTLEQYLVDAIFNLRDYFISGKLSLDALRRYLADFTVLAFARKLKIAEDLVRLFSALRCELLIPSVQEIEQKIGEEQLLRMLGSVKIFSKTKVSETVRVEILLYVKGVFSRALKPLTNYPFKVKTSARLENVDVESEHEHTTDQEGMAIISVPGYSIMEIHSPCKIAMLQYKIHGYGNADTTTIPKSKSVKIIVPGRNMKIIIIVERVSWIIYKIKTLIH
ncbi:MAG: hypothetical protein QXZ56_07350 [Sulfolobales archaeon]